MKINEKFGGNPLIGIPLQILRIMKLTTIIIMLFLMQVSALTKAQITLNEKGTSLQKVLEEISKQSGYDLVYSNLDFKNAKTVTIKLINVSVNKALEAVFEGQPLMYEVFDKTVMVKRKADQSAFDRVKDYLAVIDIRAKVTDEKGMPLPGASVRVKSTNQAAVTDAQGMFYLKGVEDNAILVISFIGYNAKEVKAFAELGSIKLEAATSKLDEVQVMAYGTTSRRLSTSNIISVKAADIEKQPVTNPLLALQGRVPGLTINQSSGYTNAGVTVRIQGKNSLSKGNDPLYVIDGVPYPSQMINKTQMSGVLGRSGNIDMNGGDAFESGNGSPLSFINPASIESIEVLKDADATAIYGSRAASGAILITTKKGKAGATKLDVNIQSGAGKVTRKLDLLNTEQYLSMRKEAFKNSGLAAPTSSSIREFFNYDLTAWDQNRYTDWQKELIGGTARYTDAQATISGGTATTQFLVGAGFHKETTVFPGDFANKKGSLNFSINNVSANQKFRIQLTGSYMADNNAVPGYDLTNEAMKLPPNAPALYNPDGSLNWETLANGVSTWANPLAFLERTYTSKTNNLVANTLLSYQILPGLDIKSSFGYTNLGTDEFAGSPLSSLAPERRASEYNQSVFLNSKLDTWILEPQVTYQRPFGNGVLNLLVGGNMTQTSAKILSTAGYGYSSDLLLHNLPSATDIYETSSQLTAYKYNAIFGRVGYNLLDKYLMNATIRRDGSSRFGPQNKLHNFGSIAAAWIFSEEDLFKKHLPFFSFGKLRLSYGTTGNDQIGDYRYLNEYEAVDVPVAYQGIKGIAPRGISNPNLAWEETRKLQGGLDLGFLKDRILINANYYRNRSSNQLTDYKLPLIAGFESIPIVNFPATVQNYGWELMLNTINIRSKNFTWSSNLNLTLAKNKLVAFENQEKTTYNYSVQYIVGQPITITSVYQYLGVNPATGLYEVANKDGNPTTTPNILIDRTQIINRSPKISGGFQNSFNYKRLQLDFLFSFAKQNGRSYRGEMPGVFVSSGGFVAGGNQPIAVLDRWQNSGDMSSYQQFSTYFFPFTTSGSTTNNALSRAGSSQLILEDASYIRLKNLALSWELPEIWLSKVNFKYLKLFLQGQNLLTFTKYSGLDPETMSTLTLPPLRVLTFGVKMGL